MVIFLDVSLPALKQRVKNFETRGIARRPDQSFEDLFAERRVLYERYGDIRIDCSHLGVNEALQAILSVLED
jgi:shikimate kinase